MSTSTIEALASAWARIAEEAEFPADYEGTATPQAHRASEAIQEQIRERIVATNDMRLFSRTLFYQGLAQLAMGFAEEDASILAELLDSVEVAA